MACLAAVGEAETEEEDEALVVEAPLDGTLRPLIRVLDSESLSLDESLDDDDEEDDDDELLLLLLELLDELTFLPSFARFAFLLWKTH